MDEQEMNEFLNPYKSSKHNKKHKKHHKHHNRERNEEVARIMKKGYKGPGSDDEVFEIATKVKRDYNVKLFYIL